MLKKYVLHLIRKERDQSYCDPAVLAKAIEKDAAIPNDPKMSKDTLDQLMGGKGIFVDFLHVHPLDEIEDGPRGEEIARLVVGYGRESLVKDPKCYCYAEDGSIEPVKIDTSLIDARQKAYLTDQARAAADRAKINAAEHERVIAEAEAQIAIAMELKTKADERKAEAAALMAEVALLEP